MDNMILLSNNKEFKPKALHKQDEESPFAMMKDEICNEDIIVIIFYAPIP